MQKDQVEHEGQKQQKSHGTARDFDASKHDPRSDDRPLYMKTAHWNTHWSRRFPRCENNNFNFIESRQKTRARVKGLKEGESVARRRTGFKRAGSMVLSYLSPLHDLLGFGVEKEIPPQGLTQHLLPNTHLLAVDAGKLLNAGGKKGRHPRSINS
jgi:hypothetical protein